MNLPPDKARLLRQYDNEKKWDLICDQVRSWTQKLLNLRCDCTHTCPNNPLYTNTVTSTNTHYYAHTVVCLQERFQVKNPPHTYIQKLRGYLDPGVTRKVGRGTHADFTHQSLFKWICQLSLLIRWRLDNDKSAAKLSPFIVSCRSFAGGCRNLRKS